MLAQDENVAPYLREFFDGKSVRAPRNTQPTQAIIDVGNLDLEELAQHPILFRYLSSHVRARRAHTRQTASREQWWRYWNRRIGLYRALQHQDRCIATVLVTRRPAFVFAPTRNIVFGHKLGVFALDKDWQLALLQSRIHTVWARHHCGARGHHSLTYAPTKCFNNFVPPTRSWYNVAGSDFCKFAKEFVAARDAALVGQNIGIAEYYQKLYDPKYTSPWIEAQREVHRQLDEQVLTQYGDAFPVPSLLETGELQSQFERRILALLYARLQAFNLPQSNSAD